MPVTRTRQPKVSQIGASRNTRDAEIARADKEYDKSCRTAWQVREAAVEEAKASSSRPSATDR